MPKISDLPVKSSPSASAYLAGVDVDENGDKINVQIPFSAFGGSSEDEAENEIIEVSVESSVVLYNIIRAILDAGKDVSIPTLVQLRGSYSNLILIWATTHGGTSYAVYCWDLTNRKAYDSSHLESTDVKVGEFFSSAYEVPFGSETSGGGIIDVEADFPSEPSTTSIYRKWQVVKVEWVYANNSSGSLETTIPTDGTMECEVVNTLPEVGNACYSGTSMYAYYQRTDGEVYGYVDSILSSAMGVPVGWYPAATLFSALDFTYNGVIDSIEDVTEGGYYALVTRKPHLYQFYNDSKGNIVKSAIITNDNYDFNETTGTLTQIIVL